MLLWRRYLVLTILTANTCSGQDSTRQRKAQLISKYKKSRSQDLLRLVGSHQHYQGNVEVYHRGRWGGVCDDEWGLEEAQVVCKQLGLGAAGAVATHSSRFGQLNDNYLMDNVRCTGEEKELSQCQFDGWSNHDCAAGEEAGVVCQTVEHHVTTPSPSHPSTSDKYKLQDIFGKGLELRLRGGRVATEGRVEFKMANGSGWWWICGEGWTLLEAQVVCRSLGLGFAQMAVQAAFISSDEDKTEGRIGLSSVECRGNETSLTDCSVSTLVHSSCPPSSPAGVICTHYMADLVIDYEEVTKSAYLEDRPLYLLQCAMEENCLARGAYTAVQSSPSWHLETRRLLRFTASILNAGNAQFTPAVPKHLWQFHQCHMHYHSMEVFASFDVLAGKEKVAEGHKASFCLEDNRCSSGAQPWFACANYGDQGISVNCSDIYKHNIDCQWVDISEIDPGIYTLKIAINPEFKVAEMSFENNAAVCRMHYGMTSVHISDCYLDRP